MKSHSLLKTAAMISLTGLLVLFLFTSLLQARPPSQPVIGTWAAPFATMTLTSAGHYTLRYPAGGEAKGRYQYQNGRLILSAADDFGQVSYTVESVDATGLSLTDPYGTPLDFSRSQQDQVRGNPLYTGTILLEKDHFQLLDSHQHLLQQFVQFQIEHPLTQANIQQLNRQTLQEFHADPALFFQQTQIRNAQLRDVYLLDNPIQIALLRQAHHINRHKRSLGTRQHNTPLPRHRWLIQRYAPVLAYDPLNQLILTQSNLEGLYRYLQLIDAIQGRPNSLTVSRKQRLKQQLIRHFQQLPPDQVQALTIAGTLSQVVAANWQTFDPLSQQQLLYRFFAPPTFPLKPGRGNQYHDYTFPTLPAPPAGDWQAIHASLVQAQRQQPLTFEALKQVPVKLANHPYWPHLNQLSLAVFANLLHLIESLGGSGDYWAMQ